MIAISDEALHKAPKPVSEQRELGEVLARNYKYHKCSRTPERTSLSALNINMIQVSAPLKDRSNNCTDCTDRIRSTCVALENLLSSDDLDARNAANLRTSVELLEEIGKTGRIMNVPLVLRLISLIHEIIEGLAEGMNYKERYDE